MLTKFINNEQYSLFDGIQTRTGGMSQLACASINLVDLLLHKLHSNYARITCINHTEYNNSD